MDKTQQKALRRLDKARGDYRWAKMGTGVSTLFVLVLILAWYLFLKWALVPQDTVIDGYIKDYRPIGGFATGLVALSIIALFCAAFAWVGFFTVREEHIQAVYAYQDALMEVMDGEGKPAVGNTGSIQYLSRPSRSW